MADIKQFDREKYISVETYRKSGTGVRTPVWFIESNGEFLFNTEDSSAKVKRIRSNPAVKIAPCNMRGDIQGEFVPGKARFLSSEETSAAKKIYSKKYGVAGWFFELMGSTRKSTRVFLAVKPD